MTTTNVLSIEQQLVGTGIGHHQLRFSDQSVNEPEQDEFEKTMVIPSGQQNAEQLAEKLEAAGSPAAEAARKAADAFARQFDFRPRAIIERLQLQRPIYRQTTNYGHFGKPEMPWEQLNRVDELKAAIKS